MITIVLSVLLALSRPSNAQMQGKGRCTTHDYEGSASALGGVEALDNSPAWCGMRYSMLNIARITAVNGLNLPAYCNLCLEITGDASSNKQPVYVLAVDQKGDPGLDIARSSFQKIFPNKNWLDPQICNWRVVDSSYCTGICVGTPGECNPGSRNLLPAYLLPKMTPALYGIDHGPQPAPAAIAQRQMNNTNAERKSATNPSKTSFGSTTSSSSSTLFFPFSSPVKSTSVTISSSSLTKEPPQSLKPTSRPQSPRDLYGVDASDKASPSNTNGPSLTEPSYISPSPKYTSTTPVINGGGNRPGDLSQIGTDSHEIYNSVSGAIGTAGDFIAFKSLLLFFVSLL